MKGFGIFGSNLRVVNGSRTVFTTEGRLVNLYPTLRTFSGRTVDFPDPPKDYIYAWRAINNWSFNPGVQDPGDPIEDYADSYSQQQSAQTFFTRTPQEYESSQVLMAAPAGANVFFGFVRLSRTTSPSHTWYFKNLNVLQEQGVWMPWQGSGLLEAAMGIARAIHLVIEGGNLVLVTEQTVGPACGGAVHQWGDYPVIFRRGSDQAGGDFKINTTAGIVVWYSTSEPYGKFRSRIIYTDGSPSSYTTTQRGQADQTSVTDPTNYRSVYNVDVKGYFGRIAGI